MHKSNLQCAYIWILCIIQSSMYYTEEDEEHPELLVADNTSPEEGEEEDMDLSLDSE